MKWLPRGSRNIALGLAFAALGAASIAVPSVHAVVQATGINMGMDPGTMVMTGLGYAGIRDMISTVANQIKG